MSAIYGTFVTPLLPFAAAYLVYLLGRAAYYRQKEYELITERYLTEGLDKISEQVDRSLAGFRSNWARSLTLLKNFRDAGKDVDPALYKSGYIEPGADDFEFWRDYRIHDLVGEDIFNRARQSLDAFVRNAYAFLAHDLCSLVRIYVEGGQELKVTTERAKIVDEYFTEVNQLDQKAHRYYLLLAELQRLSSLLQTQRFSFKTLGKFRNLDAVQESIKRMRSAFEDTDKSKSDQTSPETAKP